MSEPLRYQRPLRGGPAPYDGDPVPYDGADIDDTDGIDDIEDIAREPFNNPGA